MDCSESDLRSAIGQINMSCANNATFQRTITFNFPCGGCTIPMVQDPSGPTVCSDQLPARGKGAVCIDAHNVTVDGQNNVTFEYTGGQPTILGCACGSDRPPVATRHHAIVVDSSRHSSPCEATTTCCRTSR